MKPQRYGTSSAPCPNGIFVLAREYEALERERDALRADAERYRWLRGKNSSYESNWCVESGHEWVGEDLDAAIKTARAKEQP